MYNKIIDMIDRILMRTLPVVLLRYCRKALNGILWRCPGCMIDVPEEIETRHVALWKPICGKVDVRWLKFFSGVSGVINYTYCPYDLYMSWIERILNDYSRKGQECEDKNMLNIFANQKYCPKVFVRFIRGMFMDADYHVISPERVNDFLREDHGRIIGKVTCGSMGGFAVQAFDFKQGRYVSNKGAELTPDFMSSTKSYVIQEAVRQCDFTAKFNPSSVNTFRMITLRCPWDGKVVLLKSGFRCGVSDLPVDNLSSGGICVPVDENGNLSEFAYTYMYKAKYGRFTQHPRTGIIFKGQRHPEFSKMRDAVVETAARIPNFNILGFDVVVTQDGEVKFLEINACLLSIDWMQYGFGSLFGQYTKKVIEWCVANKNLATRRIINV